VGKAPSDEILWRPTEKYLSESNLRRFMDRHGISDYRKLQRRSVLDIEWFWEAALKDLGVDWYRPYTHILDDSDGFPWCRWVVSGQVNITYNCGDRHALSRPEAAAILWEGENGQTRQLKYSELAAEVSRVAVALRGAIKRRYLGLPQNDVSSIENPEALDSIPKMADGGQ
jgi:acetyl-CoA synthetase